MYDSEKVKIFKFSSRSSQRSLEQALNQFFQSPELEVFLFVVNIQAIAKAKLYVNHIRIIIEQTENEQNFSTFNCKKMFMLLLLFPPTSFIKACYPSIFLDGWEHYYLDSIASSAYDDPTICSYINIQEWFRQFCLGGNATELANVGSFLNKILHETIPNLVSRLHFTSNSKYLNKKMSGHKRKEQIFNLLCKKEVGNILIERFRCCWKQDTVSNYIYRTASHTFDHDSTLNLADQIQVIVRHLFTEFLVYMLHIMNRNMGIDIFFDEEYSIAVELYKKLIETIRIPKLTDLEGPICHNEIMNDMMNSKYHKPNHFPYFHYIYHLLSKIIATCREINTEQKKDTTWKEITSSATKDWEAILQDEIVSFA